jgi:hypothetical protein
MSLGPRVRWSTPAALASNQGADAALIGVPAITLSSAYGGLALVLASMRESGCADDGACLREQRDYSLATAAADRLRLECLRAGEVIPSWAERLRPSR